jgi:hypothetical protein
LLFHNNPIRMAGGTIGEFFQGDACLNMPGSDRGFLMIVAAVACVAGVTLVMANLTFGFPGLAMIEREVVRFEMSRSPGAGCVAVLAREAEETGVKLGFGVATHTFLWCACVYLIDMTSLAFDLGMPVLQRENRVVVEVAHPITTVVAPLACLPVLGLMFEHKGGTVLFSGMAVYAGICIKGDQAALMAVVTVDYIAFEVEPMTHERESGMRLMIERLTLEDRRGPAAGRVAGFACALKHTVMHGGFGMATAAFNRGTFK